MSEIIQPILLAAENLSEWTQTGLYLATLLVGLGGIFAKQSSDGKHMQNAIMDLQKKMDKHNDIVQRLVKVEQITVSAHKRIDDFCNEYKDYKNYIERKLSNGS